MRGQAERLLAKSWLPVEAAMVGKDYLIGDFSAADTMLGHACIMSQRLGIITEEAFPLLTAYAARLLARPACATAFSS